MSQPETKVTNEVKINSNSQVFIQIPLERTMAEKAADAEPRMISVRIADIDFASDSTVTGFSTVVMKSGYKFEAWRSAVQITKLINAALQHYKDTV